MAERKPEEVFASMNMDKKRCTDTAHSEKLCSTMMEVARMAGVVEKGCDKNMGNLLYAIATETPAKCVQHRQFLATTVASGRLATRQQLLAAFKFLETVTGAVNEKEFDTFCGIGVTVSQETITAVVTDAHKAAKAGATVGDLMKVLKNDERLKWADQALVRKTVETLVQPAAAPAEKKAPQQQQQQQTQKQHDVEPPKEDMKLPAAVLAHIRDLDALDGKRVRVHGWIANIREARKNMVFIVLRDGSGYLQILLSGAHLAHPGLVEKYLTRESALEVTGVVNKIPEGQHGPQLPRASGVELHADYWRAVGVASTEIEKLVTPDSDIPQLCDQRHIVLRGTRGASMLQVRSNLLQAFREFYWSKNFTEVTPPTIVQTFCEGGSDLFKLDYYGEPAYLTQSSQLYLETVLPAVHDTFCILPSFRAEKSRTPRHLAEFTHLEAEMGFIEFDNLLDHLENIICDVIEKVMSRVGDLVMYFNPNFKVPKRPFKRMNYGDAIKFCVEHNIINTETGKPFNYGEDITEKPEREMTNMIGTPILLTRFPTAMKAFYMRKCADNPDETQSVDVLMPGVGEIVGGSMRIHDYDELMAAYKRVGIDPAPYYWFTDQRRFGTCPHGGYGIGVERMLMWMLGEDHIRKLCLYPRHIGRCSP